VNTWVVAVELGLLVLAYGFAVLRQPDRSPFHPAAFLAGVLALAVALVSPLHGVAERSLAGHMVQHVILVSVAAPLLARGRPLALAARTLGRREPGAVSWRWLAFTATVQVTTLLTWHAPALFDAAVRRPPVHELEHALLLITAFAMWDALFRLRSAQGGAATVALFVATLPAMAYGFALSLAHHPWYATYRGHDLADQQLAGVVMWAYGGLAAVIGGVALGVVWLSALEQASPGVPTTAGRTS
jgi:putative membrane protein